MTSNVETATPSTRPAFAKDVLDFFTAHQAPFGCTNILEPHLPSVRRVTELVCNVLTIDYAISKLADCSAHTGYLTDFAERWRNPAPGCVDASDPVDLDARGWFSSERAVYSSHLARLSGMDRAQLRESVERALADRMEALHLFVPKQCNLACRGCYASAVPVDAEPYTDADVSAYYEGAKQILAEARALGAQVVQTSGDGEPTIFPRFFDLLDWVEQQGLQWLIFTAGLIFSSETAARQHWEVCRKHLSARIRDRIGADITQEEARGSRTPIAAAFLRELARHRDHIHIYHSIWSTRAATNTRWRNPRFGDYDYVQVQAREHTLELPSSLIAFMEIFDGERRERLGIDMPVGEDSAIDIPGMATFVVDNGLKSYFQPALVTGRAKRGLHRDEPVKLQRRSDAVVQDILKQAAPLLVRSLCSFRFIHQPIVKVHRDHGELGFYTSPGAAIDVKDLHSLGFLSEMKITSGALLNALHAPLVVHANYAYTSGCKCNDFTARMLGDREELTAEWRRAVTALSRPNVTSQWLLEGLQNQV